MKRRKKKVKLRLVCHHESWVLPVQHQFFIESSASFFPSLGVSVCLSHFLVVIGNIPCSRIYSRSLRLFVLYDALLHFLVLFLRWLPFAFFIESLSPSSVSGVIRNSKGFAGQSRFGS